jgi:CheY-like chemotaxis protein
MTDLNNKTLKVLIVEDDPITVYINQCLLHHYEVDAVTNGYAALEKVQTDRFDVILMDINLGDINMDGIRTMREIRKLRSQNHLRIIAITSYASNKQWYLEQGFDGFFLKPLDPEDIIKAVGSAPRQRHSQRLTAF